VSALAGLFALAALSTLDSRAIMVTLPAIASSFGVTPGTAGYAVTAYAVPYGIFQLAYGPLSDRYGRLAVVRAAGVGFAITTAASGIAPSLATFVAARLATGVFAAAMVSTTFTYIGDTVPYARRQIVVGQFGASQAGAQIAALTLSGLVAYVWTWRVVFDAIAAAGVACLVALAGRADDRPPPATARPPSYLAILALPNVWRVCGAVLVEGVFALGGMTYYAVIAKRRFGVNDLQAGLLLGCFGVGAVLASLSLRPLAPRLGERRLAMLGGATHAAGWLGLGFARTSGAAVAAFLLLGAGYVWLHSTLQTRGTELSAEARGKAFALFAVSLFAGVAISAAVLGRLIDAGLVGTMAAVCAGGIVAVAAWVAAQPVSG
jgi:MFS transporter, YNFM family, putative membrane transport protein